MAGEYVTKCDKCGVETKSDDLTQKALNINFSASNETGYADICKGCLIEMAQSEDFTGEVQKIIDERKKHDKERRAAESKMYGY